MKLFSLKTFIIIVVAVLVAVFLMAGIQWPEREDKAKTAYSCINNLRCLDSAKQQWALENNKGSNAVPSWSDLYPYLVNVLFAKKRYLPTNPSEDDMKLVCPAGGTYIIERVDLLPKCSISNHQYIFSGISIEVIDGDKKPLPGAIVKALDPTNHQAEGQTDQNGWVTVKTMPDLPMAHSWFDINEDFEWVKRWPYLPTFIIISKDGFVTSSNSFQTIWSNPIVQLKRK